MTAPVDVEDQAAEVVELAVSKACREELHLWCKGKAGQHGGRLRAHAIRCRRGRHHGVSPWVHAAPVRSLGLMYRRRDRRS